MGRHSASRIAAASGLSAGPKAGPAKYVSGVGAVALSLWAGAAIAGGGIANADETSSNAADPGGAVKSALHSLTAGLRHGVADASAADSAVKLPKPGLFTLPKLTDAGAKVLTGPLSGLAGRPSHQDATDASVVKASSQRSIQSTTGFVKSTPIVDATVAAVRGDTEPVNVTTFGAADSLVATTPSASLTSFAPAAARTLATPSTATVASGFLTALGSFQPTNGGTPVLPSASNLLGALQLVRRDTAQTSLAQPLSLPTIGSLLNPTPGPAPVVAAPPTGDSYATAPPSPGDTTPVTLPGGQTIDVGKYMLESDGSVSNYGGQTYGGKTMVEPVNVIIVDPTSTTPEQATAKLNRDMTLGGFPPQAIHSGGFMGLIGMKSYGQKPALPLLAYSDNLFILPNDHGRIFGPAPLSTTGSGYVWTGTFSSETLGVSENGIPGHVYVSDDAARAALVAKLIASGQVQSVSYVPLNNAINPSDPATAGYTTGDHDGYAVVIVLK
jgi:hypothetical protein